MKNYLLGIFFLFSVLTMKAQPESPEKIKVGDTMPVFTIVSDDGKEISSERMKGKVVLINFFATWCPPCQKELAAIEETLWPKYKDNDNFEMMVIGREHTDADLKSYNEKKGFSFPYISGS